MGEAKCQYKGCMNDQMIKCWMMFKCSTLTRSHLYMWAPVAVLRRGRARFAFDHLDVAVWHHLRHGGLAEGQTSMQAKTWIKI